MSSPAEFIYVYTNDPLKYNADNDYDFIVRYKNNKWDSCIKLEQIPDSSIIYGFVGTKIYGDDYIANIHLAKKLTKNDFKLKQQ